MDDPSAFEEESATLSVRNELSLRIERRVAMLRIGERSELVDRPRTIGSAPDADVRLADPTVSRLHARVEPTDEGLWITDLESTNGTSVDGVRVARALLHDGARVRLGNAELEVRYRAEPAIVPLWPSERFGPLVGKSAAMRELFEKLSRVAQSEATVLVQGETGTGKELVAQAIHEASPRKSGPFVVVDCGAIPEPLFESELFGHVRGAFTGADRAREGAVSLASGGTLFLDEIGELPLSMQPKLLRMLESRTVRRVGEAAHRPVDVRVVAATHRDLARMVAMGSFREDLFFRVAVLPVVVPPLRGRREDVPLLAAHFLAGRSVDASVLRDVESCPWLGNVRELRTFVERAVALGADEARRSLATAARKSALPSVDLERPFKELREEWNDHLEREYLRGWLERTGWNVKAAADAMGLDRTYVHRLLKKHDLSR